MSTLKKASLNLMVKMAHDLIDLEAYRATFEHIDTDDSGNITMDELKAALKMHGLQYDTKEAKRVIREVDF